jgi:hypothetical protein
VGEERQTKMVKTHSISQSQCHVTFAHKMWGLRGVCLDGADVANQIKIPHFNQVWPNNVWVCQCVSVSECVGVLLPPNKTNGEFKIIQSKIKMKTKINTKPDHPHPNHSPNQCGPSPAGQASPCWCLRGHTPTPFPSHHPQ